MTPDKLDVVQTINDKRHRNNRNFKFLKYGLGLRYFEIIEICKLGGLTISRDRQRRWGTSETLSGGDYTIMKNHEFDAFCSGLAEWLRDDNSVSNNKNSSGDNEENFT